MSNQVTSGWALMVVGYGQEPAVVHYFDVGIPDKEMAIEAVRQSERRGIDITIEATARLSEAALKRLEVMPGEIWRR